MSKITKKIRAFVGGVKNKYLLQKYQRNNSLHVERSVYKNLRLEIYGKNNILIINNVHLTFDTIIEINIHGDNNVIEINDVFIREKLTLQFGQKHPNFGSIRYHKLRIQPGTSIESMQYVTYNSNAECSIGKNCMLSSDILLYNTDAHAILEYSSGKLTNYVQGIYIGDHCWIGQSVKIMKNTVIPSDSIIGAFSLVCGKLVCEHSIYAGIPAKLIKSNRTWDANGKKHGYIDNVF